jgi:hypothetical protein
MCLPVAELTPPNVVGVCQPLNQEFGIELIVAGLWYRGTVRVFIADSSLAVSRGFSWNLAILRKPFLCGRFWGPEIPQ